MSSRRAVSAAELAERAYDLVQVDPRKALVLAKRALAASVDDAAAEIASRYALGWAQHVVGDHRSGRVTLGAGIELARRTGDRRSEGLLRRLLGFWLALDGEVVTARKEVDAAIALLSGVDRARSQVHRLEVYRKTNDPDPARRRRVVADAATALRVLRGERDEIWVARLLNIRGLLYFDRGELDAAEADLTEAREIFERLGARAVAADMAVLLAHVALLRGDVLGAFRTLENVQPALATATPEYNLENLEECRLRALVQARLLPEARAAAEGLLDLCTRTGRRDWIPAVTLDLAGIAVMSGDFAGARGFALQAERSFIRRGKPVNAALARATMVRSRLEQGSLQGRSLESVLEAAAVLETARWRRDALRTRVLAARVALGTGRRGAAAEQLRLAMPLHVRGTVTDRIELLHTRALVSEVDGDGVMAQRLLRRALRLLDEYRAALGSTDLRANASGIGVALSQSGLRMAVESGRPALAFEWAERARAASIQLAPVSPSSDRKLRTLQAELRRVTEQIRSAESAGHRIRGLASRRTSLEGAIRTRTRLARGNGAGLRGLPGTGEAARELGGRVLVEYAERDGMLIALTLKGRRLELHQLGESDVLEPLDWLRFALGRLARGTANADERAAALAGADDAARVLDDRLVGPVRAALGDAPLVVVPTGSLHAVPWGALPSLRGRAIVVVPSLVTWLDLKRRPRARSRRLALVAGPRLRHSRAEVNGLAKHHPGATVLTGMAATAKATLGALDGAALAHLACHGRFRSDSPLFSSLELADGPLNVYELQRLRKAPDVVVLSACDLAQSGVQPGDELLGLAAALLGMGTRTIVASVVPVPDAGAKSLMLDLHRRLVAGTDLATALAEAQAGRPESGFVCLGAA